MFAGALLDVCADLEPCAANIEGSQGKTSIELIRTDRMESMRLPEPCFFVSSIFKVLKDVVRSAMSPNLSGASGFQSP